MKSVILVSLYSLLEGRDANLIHHSIRKITRILIFAYTFLICIIFRNQITQRYDSMKTGNENCTMREQLVEQFLYM